ncbi:MAG: tripartite tricarboxylate transporter substrate-binding protein [Arenicella sp.]
MLQGNVNKKDQFSKFYVFSNVRVFLFSFLVLWVVQLFSASNTFAEEIDFSGETIEWVIPFHKGGGSTKWAYFYAPLLAEELPGKPRIVIKNVPGASSTIGANQFAAQAKPDGLTLLGTSGSTQFPYMLGDSRVKYDYKDWKVILATPSGGVVYIDSKSSINQAADLAKQYKPLLFGSLGVTSLDLIPLLAFELLGANVDAIFGMKGRKAGRLAFQRGVTTIDFQTSSLYLAEVHEDVLSGKVTALMSWGALDKEGKVVRDPTFPDLPSFPEVYEQVYGEAPSGPAWDAWKAFFVAGFPAQKMVFLPKGTPDNITRVYTEAFERVIAKPGFSDAAKKILGSYPQMTGLEAQATLEQAIGVNKDATQWVQNWLTEKYQVSFN